MSKFSPPPLTAEEVREYRERTGASMMDAKKVLQGQLDYQELRNLRRDGSLEDKVEFLLDKYEKRL